MTRPYIPPPPDDPQRPPRRRYSPWTLLAPAALLVVVIMSFSALGSSCVFKECGPDATKAAAGSTPAEEAVKTKKQEKPYLFGKDGELKPRWKVREGQSAQEIAEDFDLTIEELKACNPHVIDIRQLRTGQFLHVEHKRCKGAKPKDAGAIVDPSAGTPAEISSESTSGDGGDAAAGGN